MVAAEICSLGRKNNTATVSFEIIQSHLGTNRKPVGDFLWVNITQLHRIVHCFWDIADQSINQIIAANKMFDIGNIGQSHPHYSFDSNLLLGLGGRWGIRWTLSRKIEHVWSVRLCQKTQNSFKSNSFKIHSTLLPTWQHRWSNIWLCRSNVQLVAFDNVTSVDKA